MITRGSEITPTRASPQQMHKRWFWKGWGGPFYWTQPSHDCFSVSFTLVSVRFYWTWAAILSQEHEDELGLTEKAFLSKLQKWQGLLINKAMNLNIALGPGHGNMVYIASCFLYENSSIQIATWEESSDKLYTCFRRSFSYLFSFSPHFREKNHPKQGFCILMFGYYIISHK